MEGYIINFSSGKLWYLTDIDTSPKNVLFSGWKQAKSALAFAKLSQVIRNNKTFGGIISDSEWDSDSIKYTIIRIGNNIICDHTYNRYTFLAFHTEEQRDLFLEENIELIKQYYML